MAKYSASVTVTSVDFSGQPQQLLVADARGTLILEGERQTLVLESGRIVRPLSEHQPVVVSGVASVPPPAIGTFRFESTMAVTELPPPPAQFPIGMQGPIFLQVKGVPQHAAAGANS